MAESAMTLLKNEPLSLAAGAAADMSSPPLLPLDANSKIALIGPQCNFTLEMLSNYAGASAVQNLIMRNHRHCARVFVCCCLSFSPPPPGPCSSVPLPACL